MIFKLEYEKKFLFTVMMLGHLLCHQVGFVPIFISRLCFPPSEIQALLLSDCLVLLQRGPDDRLQLRYPSRWLGGGGGGGGDSKTSFSPLVKLDSLLVRSVATGNTAVTFLIKQNLKRSSFCGAELVISLQTTKPSTSSAPLRGRSTSWWPGRHPRKTRKRVLVKF